MQRAAPLKSTPEESDAQTCTNEKRKHSRKPLDVEVSCEVQGAEGPITGTGKDVSLGGMFIECQTPPRFGTELQVHLTLPAQPGTLVLPAVVRWRNNGGFGVQFKLLGARETFAITRFIRP